MVRVDQKPQLFLYNKTAEDKHAVNFIIVEALSSDNVLLSVPTAHYNNIKIAFNLTPKSRINKKDRCDERNLWY